VTFEVLRGIKHECLIGWDMLHQYGWAITDTENEAMLLWGQRYFPLHNENGIEIGEIAVTDAGCLTETVTKYDSVFGEPGRLALGKLPALHIKTDCPVPLAQRPYRAPLNKREIIDNEIDTMLALGVIQPSNSPWASPVTLVPKRDGTWRFCVDYRLLNSHTVKDRHPLPLVSDIFDSMAGCSIFSAVDMKTGFWQLPVAEDSRAKTAFVCHRGQFEFLRMPFGLANAPATYQRAMNEILAPFIGKFVQVFIDDVVIYSKTEREHNNHVSQVLEAISKAGLTLKKSKCIWAQKSIPLLGYIVSKQGIQSQPSKTSAIRALPPPTDLHELRRFLGMTGYYRQLIQGYANVAEPLYRLTRKDTVFHWGTEEDMAFEKLKTSLCEAPVMAHPDLSKPYVLYTDACDYAIGGVLCQLDENGIERPIQYISAGLSSIQKRWATIEKEAYAVIYCLKKLRAYLLGAEFRVLTDHKPLLCLFTKEMINTKIQRWAVLMAEFGAKVEYRKGSNNVRADMLSRIKAPSEMAVFEVDEDWVESPINSETLTPNEVDGLSNDEVRTAQRRQYAEEIELTHDINDKFIIDNGLLYSISRPDAKQARYPRIMLPREFTDDIIKRCHLESGHSGLVKTLARIQEHYVWPGMRKQTQDYLNKCGLCIVSMRTQERPPMGEMPVAKGPGQIVGIDLMGPLTPSAEKENRYLLVCIDHFSGWIEAYPIPNKNNDTIVERLANDYLPRHGSPTVLITDRGTEFGTKEFDEWLRGNAIERRRTSGYNPQSNGKTERANGTIRRMLEKLVNADRPKWEDRLGAALTAVRNNVSSTTGFAPFMLHHARPARVAIGRFADGSREVQWSDRLRIQADVTEQAIANIVKSREPNRERFERRANAKDLQPGDEVVVKGQRLTPLTAKWDHNFTVVGVRGKVVSVMHHPTGKTARYNRNKIKLVDPDVSWDGVRDRPKAQNVIPLQAQPLERHPVGRPPKQKPRVPPIPHFPKPRRKRKPSESDDPEWLPPRAKSRCVHHDPMEVAYCSFCSCVN
jgi:transposase InsO family protein